jgi:hypothetical protein
LTNNPGWDNVGLLINYKGAHKMGMLDYDLTDALEMPRHGSAEDRGSADAYYGRQPEPHYYEGATMTSPKRTDLTEEENRAYWKGYREQVERKDWG